MATTKKKKQAKESKKAFWAYDIQVSDRDYFENIYKPVEIFSSQKHDGYYIRGQVGMALT